MQKEFKIKSRPELQFRTAFKSSLEVLSFKMTINFKDPDSMTNSMAWLLERVEVELAGSWVPVKEHGFEVYNPADLQEDYNSLMQITIEVFDIIKDVFQQSRKSSRKQQ